MAERTILDIKSREFFRIVAQAAFSNPFGPEYFELNCKIAEGKYETFEILNKKIIPYKDLGPRFLASDSSFFLLF